MTRIVTINPMIPEGPRMAISSFPRQQTHCRAQPALTPTSIGGRTRSRVVDSAECGVLLTAVMRGPGGFPGPLALGAASLGPLGPQLTASTRTTRRKLSKRAA